MLSKKMKTMLFLFSILTIGFITTSFVSYFVANDSLNDQISHDTLPLIGDTIYSEIQTDLVKPVVISALMAKDTFLQDWVIDGEKDISKITNYLHEIKQSYNAVTSFFVSNQSLNYYHPNGLVKQISTSDPQDKWFFRVKAIKDTHELNIDYDELNNGAFTVFINYKVIDAEGNFLGVTGIGLALSKVKSLINEYQKKYQKEVFFIDNKGSVKLSNPIKEQGINLNADIGGKPLKDLVFNKATRSFNYHINDHHIMLDSRYVEEFDWYLIVRQTTNKYGEEIYSSLILNLTISAIVTLIILIITWFTLGNYQQRLEEMAITDKLTGLNNRQMFDPLLHQQFNSAHKSQSDLSTMIIDIDDFKIVNDKYGHLVGDKVLMAVANMLKHLQRDADSLCRWGGEEFLFLMPQCNKEQALQHAKKIQQHFSSSTFTIDSINLSITLSIGIADNKTQETPKAEDLIYRADQALLVAKRTGKNKISLDTA